MMPILNCEKKEKKKKDEGRIIESRWQVSQWKREKKERAFDWTINQLS